MNNKIRTSPYSAPTIKNTPNSTRSIVESFSSRLHMIIDFQQNYYNTVQKARELVEQVAEQNAKFILQVIVSDTGERVHRIGKALGPKREINITQQEILAVILEQLRILVGIPHITLVDIAYTIKPLLQSGYFSQTQQDDIFIGLEKYFQDYKKTEEKFMTYDRASGARSIELLKEVAPEYMKQIFAFVQLGEIVVRIYRGSIIFFFKNPQDYAQLCNNHVQSNLVSGGTYFSEPISKDFTFGNVIFVDGGNYDEKIVIHEVTHRKTIYTDEFVSKSSYDGIEDIFGPARDEILSYMEEDMQIDELKEILLNYNGGYNPIPRRRPDGRKKRKEVWRYYSKELDTFIDAAYEIKSLYPNLYMYILTSIPPTFWKYMALQDK